LWVLLQSTGKTALRLPAALPQHGLTDDAQMGALECVCIWALPQEHVFRLLCPS